MRAINAFFLYVRKHWQAVFSNPDTDQGEGIRETYHTMPIHMWAAIEILPEGEYRVVGLILGNLCQLEPPLDDTFLGYTYQGDNLTDAYGTPPHSPGMKIDNIEHPHRDSGAAAGNETSITVLKQARGQKPP